MKRLSSKDWSAIQEYEIAKLVGGRVQANSGGTVFGGGDIHTKTVLIEAKTTTKPKSSFSIKKEWIAKANEQAFEQGKPYSSVAFRFAPEEEDYFIINGRLFKELVHHLNMSLDFD